MRPGVTSLASSERLARTALDARPLPVRVYEAVRDDIVSGAIPPDTRLVQEQLAESLGVSRTPVRDALNRLAHEGLVTWIPGTGYLVNRLSDESVKDIYEVRQSLEPLAVRLAAGRHTRAQLAQLWALLEQASDGDDWDSGAWFEWNRDFHVALVAPAGNALLLHLLHELWSNPVNRLITHAYARDREHIDRMILEHEALVDAAQRGDADEMAHLIQDHLQFGYGETSESPLH